VEASFAFIFETQKEGLVVHTIVLEDFGVFLGKKSERFVIRKKGTVIGEFPASEVERIIVSSSGASMSSSALYLAVEKRIPVAFTYSSGRPFAFLTPTMGHGTVLTRRAQYTEATTVVGSGLVIGFVKGKLLNQRCLLNAWAKNRTRTRPDVSEALFLHVSRLDGILEELYHASTPLDDRLRASLMNIEGRGASEYWRGVSLVLPPEFEFTSRNTRGAKDPFNMMLNYGYGILYSEVWSAVNIAGLDPFAGFLHVDRPGRPSLVLDLIEEFRQQVVDRVLVTLTTKNTISAKDVADDDGLSKHTREKLVSAIVGRLSERVTIGKKKIPLKNVITRQAWAAAKFLRRESTKYTPFSLRW